MELMTKSRESSQDRTEQDSVRQDKAAPPSRHGYQKAKRSRGRQKQVSRTCLGCEPHHARYTFMSEQLQSSFRIGTLSDHR